jgi:hypothetical protein
MEEKKGMGKKGRLQLGCLLRGKIILRKALLSKV